MFPRVSLRFRSPLNNRKLIIACAVSSGLLALCAGLWRQTASADAAPAPFFQAPSHFVRRLTLSANDIVYNPMDQTIYASIPSSAGVIGNSLIPINPVTGATGTPVFVGSEPGKLAMADDGHTVYVFLDGAYALRKFDTLTQTPGLQFGVGSDSFHGIYRGNDFVVAPGNANVVAVARYYLGTSPPEAGVAIFDNGVQRPTTTPGHTVGANYLAFSNSDTKLYGGGDNQLQTITVNASGATITSNTTFVVGNVIKFANGRIYSSSGQVVDPDTGTLLGTFPSTASNAFVPDPASGRAFFIVRDFTNGQLTLKAFDINTFVLIGTTTFSSTGAGEPTNLLRWGSNGLALRTSTGEVYLIQTSFIPSADPIPTPTPIQPTPTPTPTPVIPTFIREVPLPANDLLYNSQNQMLYASVPSSIGAGGNSVTQVNPVNAQLGASLFVGSEPGRLAASDDNQTMYVGLNGAGAVRRFDTALTTAGLQFSLGNGSFDGPFRPDDIAVMPGNPGTVAVSRLNGTTLVYDNGTPRSQGGGSGQVDFGSPTRLYITSGPIFKMDVGPSGLTQVGDPVITATNGTTELINGLLYFSGGGVVNPETGEIKGRYGSSGFSSDSAFAVDQTLGKIFFLRFSSIPTLEAYDLNTFRPLASRPLTGLFSSLPFGARVRLFRWGSNGLAFNANNRIYLIQTELVSNADPVPSPTPTPSPTPIPSPAYVPTLVRTVNLPANDLAIRTDTQTLYASVPSTGGPIGNSITPINPQTAAIGTSVPVGSEPNRIAISSDNQTLYVGLDGSNAVRRVDLTNHTANIQFSLGTSQFNGPLLVDDMGVAPGQSNVVAISRRNTCCSPRHEGVAIYDNGVMRPTTTQVHTGSNVIEFSNSPTTIYGYNNETTEFGFRKLTVSASGVTQTSNVMGLLGGFSTDFKFAGDSVYATNGRVLDPESNTLRGTFALNNSASLIAVDTTLGRAFVLSSNFGSAPWVLSAFDINTFLPLGSVSIPIASGTPRGLVRWGVNGLAFCTAKNFDQNSVSQVYLIQSFLVSNAEPIPSTLQFNASTYTAFEFNNNVTVTVTRTGGVSGAASVNYATSDDTATAGSDYTATSGTLNFADGEQSKTFTIPILDDDIFEGNETINVTLSNPTGSPTLGTPATAVITIQDGESAPFLGIAGANVTEGDSGTTAVNLTLTLSNRTTKTVTLNYATAPATATSDVDYVAASGTLTFNPLEKTKTLTFNIIGDLDVEGNESFSINLTNLVNTSNSSTQTTIGIIDDDSPGFRFSAPSYTVNEGDGRATLVVTRKGDTSAGASISYQTVDLSNPIRCDDTTTLPQQAFARCDYATSVDVLTFAPGVTSKSFTIPIIDDGHAEPTERVQVLLFGATGAPLMTPNNVLLSITDNDLPGGANPIFTSPFFVRQHYIDFLSREPEPDGFDAWLRVLNNCPNVENDPTCDRLIVSQSFFGSEEFRIKGFYVFLFYKTALNRLPTYAEIVVSMRQVTGQTPEEVYQKRAAFAQAFVQRSEFNTVYGAMSNSQFVTALLSPYGTTAINTIDPQNPDTGGNVVLTQTDLVNALTQGSLTRADVVRAIVQSREIGDREFNNAFVAMQYYGYLRRTPETVGYQAWLNYLSTHPGDFRTMVNGFVNSTEYRLRFGFSQ